MDRLRPLGLALAAWSLPALAFAQDAAEVVAPDAGEGTTMSGVFLMLVPALVALSVLGVFALNSFAAESTPSWLRANAIGWLLLPVGLLMLFFAQRVLGEGHPHLTLWRATAGFAILAAIGWRAAQWLRARGQAKEVETRLAVATGGVLLSLVLYWLSTDSGLEMLGQQGEAADHLGAVLRVLWPSVLVVSGAALLFMELAYSRMPIPEAVELRRVTGAAVGGMTLALSFIFVLSINFVAQEREVRRDLSYFRTTAPSDTSRRMVGALDEPVTAVLFYPRVNEVLDQLQPYFDELGARSDNFSVEVLDHALAPELARRHQVTRNGFVLLTQGEDGEGQQGQKFEIGTDLETARSRLRRLDGSFQERFSQLTTRPRELHFTAGHNERSFSAAGGDPPEERLTTLAEILERVNIDREDLGIAQGLAQRVPEGARAVAVVGPRDRFLPEEGQALLRYVQGGGRLFLMLDPDVDHGLDGLLAGFGLAMREGVLHAERQHFPRTRTSADRELAFSNEYTAHPVVTQANRNRQQAVTIFARGGALETREGDPAAANFAVSFPVRTAADGFWLDRDGDHEQGEGEPTGRFNMIAVVNTRESAGDQGRAIVIADGDFITDEWIRSRGNYFVFADSIQWLVGEEEIIGPETTEEDVRIRHTRDEDALWFYGTSFGAPLPLFLLGLFMARRRRRVAPKSQQREAPAGDRPPKDPPPGPVAEEGAAEEPTTDDEPASEDEPASDDEPANDDEEEGR